MVHGLLDIKRRGRQEGQKFGGRKQGASGQSLSIIKSRMEKEPKEGKAFQERKWHGGRVGMDFEDESESRKLLDKQGKKLQKYLRDVEKLSGVSKEVQKSLNNDLQLQEVEKRRHDLMPEHQKVQKKVRKDTKHPG